MGAMLGGSVCMRENGSLLDGTEYRQNQILPPLTLYYHYFENAALLLNCCLSAALGLCYLPLKPGLNIGSFPLRKTVL